jgi:hypothetical protein
MSLENNQKNRLDPVNPDDFTGETRNIYRSLKKVEKWVEDHGYRGYEPFDGLSSRFRFLTFNKLFLDRLLLQLVRQSPLNLRPIFLIKPLDSTIGRGYMAWGYCLLYELTEGADYRNKIDDCLHWLMENKSPQPEGYCWGKHFDFASRGGLYKSSEPILIWTALIGFAFLKAFSVLGKELYLQVADEICRWILKLPRHQTDKGICLGYHQRDRNGTIHNSNMIGAALLAAVGHETGNREYLEVARSAMSYSCSRQLPNGAWYYGEDPRCHWIDNFHTGYNLDGLKSYMDSAGDGEFTEYLARGANFYKKNLFDDLGRAKYYHNRLYPLDSQCLAQGIDTLANLSAIDPEARHLSLKVARWTVRHMQDRRGFFYYRQYPLGIKAKTPMLHWAQAATYKALAHWLFTAGPDPSPPEKLEKS